jgi:hypothetical protein
MLHFEQPQQRLAGCGYLGELFSGAVESGQGRSSFR